MTSKRYAPAIDNGLAYVKAQATAIHLLPAGTYADRAAILAASLGHKTLAAGGIFPGAIADASPNGRKLDTLNVTDGTGTASGTVAQWAIISASELLLLGDMVTPMAIASSDVWTLGPVTVPFPSAEVLILNSGWSMVDQQDPNFLVFTNSNRTMATSVVGDYGAVRGVQSRTSGKRYFEIRIDVFAHSTSQEGIGLGIASAAHVLNNNNPPGASDNNGIAYNVWYNGVNARTGVGSWGWGAFATPPVVGGDVMGFAADLDTHDMWISVNGVWVQGNPAIGTVPMDWGDLAGAAMFPYAQLTQGSGAANMQLTLKTGSTLTYAPPAGFTAWE